MVKYYRCSREELIGFAQSRQLRLSLSKALFCRPTKPNLIQALKQADVDWTFRFLDLPPELRTWVYRELLVLQNSYSCHPAILATCRKISDEATNILYGDNLVQIKIRYDGVFAHGKKCGSYEPRPYIPRNPRQNTRWLAWPDYLRRVQFLRIDYASLSTSPMFDQLPHLATVHNILYSLCSFLFNDHRLRSLDVLEKIIGTAIYPLRLLGNLKQLQIEGLPARVMNVLEATPMTLKLADEVLKKPVRSLLKHNHAANTTKDELTVIASCYDYRGNIDPTPEAVLLSIQTLGVGRMVFSLPNLLAQSANNIHPGEAQLRQFLRPVDDIRQQWEMARPLHITETLMRRVDRLVRLDVELKLALSRR